MNDVINTNLTKMNISQDLDRFGKVKKTIENHK